MRNPVSAIVMIMFSFLFLAACGQKGPLFLPGNPSSLQSIPSTEELQQQAEEDADDEKEEEKNAPNINNK